MGVLAVVLGQDDDEPLLTGSQADFSDRGQFSMERRAAPATSIKIGGTYYNYNRIEPLGTSLAAMVNLANAIKQSKSGKNTDDLIGDLFKQTINLARDKSFMMGIGDVMRALEYPEKGVPRWISNFATSWSPNILRSTVRSTDTSFRDYTVRGKGIAWFEDLAKKTGKRAFPLSSFAPHVKVDVWGRDRKRFEGALPFTDFLWRTTVPVFRQDADKIHKLDRLIMKYNAGNPSDTWYPSLPRPDFKRNGKQYRMNDAEYHAYLRETGKAASETLLDPKNKLNFDDPEEKDIKRMQKELDKARTTYKTNLVDKGKIKPAAKK